MRPEDKAKVEKEKRDMMLLVLAALFHHASASRSDEPLSPSLSFDRAEQFMREADKRGIKIPEVD
jgi:hypothetical protein